MGSSALNTLLFKNKNRIFSLGALSALVLIVTAYYMEIGLNLKPCILCHLQRICVFLLGLTALVGLLHRNTSYIRFVSYISVCIFFSISGALLAIRQLYLQNLPPDLIPSCAGDLSYLIETLPITDLLVTVIKGDGNCAEVAWEFIGISIPGWVLIALSTITIYFLISIKKIKTYL